MKTTQHYDWEAGDNFDSPEQKCLGSVLPDLTVVALTYPAPNKPSECTFLSSVPEDARPVHYDNLAKDGWKLPLLASLVLYGSRCIH